MKTRHLIAAALLAVVSIALPAAAAVKAWEQRQATTPAPAQAPP